MAAQPEPPDALVPAAAGLCHDCRHARAIVSDRGSVFVLCGRSRDDPTFRRYPSLPVLACRGFEATTDTSGPAGPA
jgi:hypothetical protein